jgi:general stress protein 26
MEELKNLTGQEASEKIKELSEKIKVCFLNTSAHGSFKNARPMSQLEVDDQGAIWFMSGKNSTKVKEVSDDQSVELFYSDPSTNQYMTLRGKADILFDQEKIYSLYNPLLNIWFKGKEDPEIALIKVIPEDGFYWETKSNKLIQGVKMFVGLVTGNQTDDSEEGTLTMLA